MCNRPTAYEAEYTCRVPPRPAFAFSWWLRFFPALSGRRYTEVEQKSAHDVIEQSRTLFGHLQVRLQFFLALQQLHDRFSSVVTALARGSSGVRRSCCFKLRVALWSCADMRGRPQEERSHANLDERFEAGHDVRGLENLSRGDDAAVSRYVPTVINTY